MKEYPGGIFPAYQGYFWDEESWDGSDVFMPEDESALVFVTKRVADALKRAKVRGALLERVDLVVRPER